MSEEKVIQFPLDTYYATCPECGGTEWLLPVNGLGFAWDKIVGSQCADPDCSCLIRWMIAEKSEDKVNLNKGENS